MFGSFVRNVHRLVAKLAATATVFFGGNKNTSGEDTRRLRSRDDDSLVLKHSKPFQSPPHPKFVQIPDQDLRARVLRTARLNTRRREARRRVVTWSTPTWSHGARRRSHMEHADVVTWSTPTWSHGARRRVVTWSTPTWSHGARRRVVTWSTSTCGHMEHADVVTWSTPT